MNNSIPPQFLQPRVRLDYADAKSGVAEGIIARARADRWRSNAPRP